MRSPDENEFDRIENLLRAAAGFEPARAVPPGLAVKALNSLKKPRGDWRLTAGIGAALAVACSAAGLVFLNIQEPHGEDPAVRTAHVEAPRDLFPPPEDRSPKKRAAPKSPAGSTGLKITDAFERRPVPIRRGRPRSKARPGRRAVVAKAEVTVETVHIFETGVIAPVLISTPDEQSGSTTMQASLMEFPLEYREVSVPREYDSSHHQLTGNKENP